MDRKTPQTQHLVGLASQHGEAEAVVDAKQSARADRFALLYDLGCAFAARIELDELIPLVVEKCRDVLDAEGISVLLLDHENNQLYFPYVSQVDPEILKRLLSLRFPAELGVAGAALKRAARFVSPTRSTTRAFTMGLTW